MINLPNVCQTKSNQVYVTFYIQEKRFRLYNGDKFNIPISPNSFPVSRRFQMGQLLAAEIYKKLLYGIKPSEEAKGVKPKHESDLEYLTGALKIKLRESHSNHHQKALKYAYKKLTEGLWGEEITKAYVEKVLSTYTNNTSFNTIRRNLNILFVKAVELGMKENPAKTIRPRRAKAKLHKSYNNIGGILEEIKHFDEKLYLCCLLTYGCLLRPHREIRELTWGDFSADLSHIHLSGSRNKSGRNRIVPVPSYIRSVLETGARNHNMFSGTAAPHNADYFKTVWGRFKKTSKLLEEGQTLYSFRHSGAIDIFKRTGSLTKLQKAMGHSNLKVSLTYLRGLEVAELKEEDMPMVYKKNAPKS